MEGLGFKFRYGKDTFYFLQNAQTSCFMGIGVYPGIKRPRREVSYSYLVPRLKVCGIYLCPHIYFHAVKRERVSVEVPLWAKCSVVSSTGGGA
jgi:hypothetical protein